jgi:hypothetical protein
MDGEWNFLSHQLGMLYTHTASQKMDPSGAIHLLTPFDSVFHATARCINEQMMDLLCENSAQSAYIRDVYMNTSSASLAFVYFLKGPLYSLFEIIRFMRRHLDPYYSKDKIDDISTNTMNISMSQAAQQARDEKYREQNREISRIALRQSFLASYGMIIDTGMHPHNLPRETTYIIDAQNKNQQKYNRIQTQFKSLGNNSIENFIQN